MFDIISRIVGFVHVKAKMHTTDTWYRVRVMVFHATFNNDSVYRGDQVNWRGKPEYTVKTTDLPQLTDKLYHIMLWQLHTAMNRIRTHNGPGGSMS
jgi:hypothetical protein